MALEKVYTYGFLLCLVFTFHLSCQQQDSYVTDCSSCCSNFSCMYELIDEGLRESEEFKDLSDLIFLNEDDTPVFIPITVNLTWMECCQDTSETKTFSKGYIWGRNPTYATFGPVQEFFQSLIFFDVLIKAVAILEQILVPKVHLKEGYLENWVIEHDQTLTVDISGAMCISDIHVSDLTLEDALKLVIGEVLTKLKVEGSVFHANISGHVLSKEEVKLVVNVFVALYVCSWMFLVFFVVFVGLSILSTNLWKEVNSGKYCQLFYSSSVVVVFLAFFDILISLGLFVMEAIHITTNKPVWFMKDPTKKFVHQYRAYLLSFLSIRLFTFMSFFIFIVLYLLRKCNATGPQSQETYKGSSGLFLLLYIFMALFQLVPVMSHLVMYPLRTFSYIVQYLCSICIILLFAYQLTMCACRYCELRSSRPPEEGRQASQQPHSSHPPEEGRQALQQPESSHLLEEGRQALQQPESSHLLEQGRQALQQPDPKPQDNLKKPAEKSHTNCAQKCCMCVKQAFMSLSGFVCCYRKRNGYIEISDQEAPTNYTQKWYMYLLTAFMSLFGFVLILLIGFLCFAVTFMEVNPATLTMFVITIMAGVISTTISDKLIEWLGKLLPSEGSAG